MAGDSPGRSFSLVYDSLNGLLTYDVATGESRAIELVGVDEWPDGPTSIAPYDQHSLLLGRQRRTSGYSLLSVDTRTWRVTDMGDGRHPVYLPTPGILVYYDVDRLAPEPKYTRSGATIFHVVARKGSGDGSEAKIIAPGPWPMEPLVVIPPDEVVIPGGEEGRGVYVYGFSNGELRQLTSSNDLVPRAWREITSELVCFNERSRRVQYLNVKTGAVRDAENLKRDEIPQVYLADSDSLVITARSIRETGGVPYELYETWLVELGTGKRQRLDLKGGVQAGYAVATHIAAASGR